MQAAYLSGVNYGVPSSSHNDDPGKYSSGTAALLSDDLLGRFDEVPEERDGLIWAACTIKEQIT